MTLSAETARYVKRREANDPERTHDPASREGDPDLHVAEGDLPVSHADLARDLRPGNAHHPGPGPRPVPAPQPGGRIQATGRAEWPGGHRPVGGCHPGQTQPVLDAPEPARPALPLDAGVQPADHGAGPAPI